MLPEPLEVGSCGPRYPAFATYSSRISSYKLCPEYFQQEPADLAGAGFFNEGSNGKVCCFYCGAKIKRWEPEDDPYIEHARWYPKCSYLKEQKGEQFIKDVQSGRIIIQMTDRPKVTKERKGTCVSSDDSVVRNVANIDYTKEELQHAMQDEQMATEVTLEAMRETERSDRKQRNTSKIILKYNNDYEKLQKERTMLINQKKCKICWDQDASVVFLPCGHLASCTFCSPSFHKCPICRANIKDTMEAIVT